jgi:uncharacterized protein
MTRPFAELPAWAAWRHHGARVGFEVLFARRDADGVRLEGHSAAVEDGVAWGLRYTFLVDASWRTCSAHIAARSSLGAHEVLLEGHAGEWRVDGRPAPELSGCLDVDLEASACTNTLPVRRLALHVGGRAEAPAVYVRAADLSVERLEQSYARLPSDGEHSRYDYASPAFDFRATLLYDECGLVLEYPGIALRVA